MRQHRSWCWPRTTPRASSTSCKPCLRRCQLELVAPGELAFPKPTSRYRTFIENALTKARHAAQASGLPAIADDAGLCVDAFGGLPGVDTADYATQFGYDPKGDANNVRALLEQLAGHTQPTRAPWSARWWRCARQDPQPLVAVGRVAGRDPRRASRRRNGFRLRPADVHPRTSARPWRELPVEVKNAHSHRGPWRNAHAAAEAWGCDPDRPEGGGPGVAARHAALPAPGHLQLPALPPLSLYVHLPWCLKKCPYCDFNSHETAAQRERRRELDEASAMSMRWWPTWRPRCLWCGAGACTASSSAAARPACSRRRHIDRCWVPPRAPAAGSRLPRSRWRPTPARFEKDRFRAFRAAGVTRLSVGVQSFDDNHLKALGRVHDGAQAGPR
jgi:XTP/dITP diphosphohydrolase